MAYRVQNYGRMMTPSSRTALELRLYELALQYPDIDPQEAAEMARMAWITAPDYEATLIMEWAEKKKKKQAS